MNKNHVCIMTPIYDGKFFSKYVDFLSVQYQYEDFSVSYRYLSGCSLVCKARNNLIYEFWSEAENNGWTHLLWLDSDVIPDNNAIDVMLKRNVDIIASPVPIKTNMSVHGMPQSILKLVKEIEPMLYTAKYAATGCLMMSKNAVNLLVQYCIDNGLIYKEGYEIFDVFKVGAYKNFYESEDWYVCRILRELGFDIYVDSSFGVAHMDGSRATWYRGAMPASETILNKQYDKELPEELRLQRWATNDFRVDDIELND